MINMIRDTIIIPQNVLNLNNGEPLPLDPNGEQITVKPNPNTDANTPKTNDINNTNNTNNINNINNVNSKNKNINSSGTFDACTGPKILAKDVSLKNTYCRPPPSLDLFDYGDICSQKFPDCKSAKYVTQNGKPVCDENDRYHLCRISKGFNYDIYPRDKTGKFLKKTGPDGKSTFAVIPKNNKSKKL